MKRLAMAMMTLGFLLGGTGTMLYTTRDLSQLRSDLHAAQQVNEELENENQFLLAESKTPAPGQILKGIQVECPQNSNRTVQATIKKQVLQSLSFLQGKSQTVLLENPYLPAYVIDPQSVYVDKRKYRLRVTLVIIAHETLYLNVVGQLQ